MSQVKSRDWLGLVANFSVVVGLVLVAFQLNQSALLLWVELGSNSYDRFVSIDHTFADATFADVWAKSLEQPESLTLSAMIQLDRYLLSIGDAVEAEFWLFELGVFAGSIDARYWADFISSSPFATAWWNVAKFAYLDGLVESIDERIADPSNRFGIERYQHIKVQLNRPTSD